MRAHPRPLILGHRGAPRDAPENTLRAFRLAMQQGADGVELDVQPSADGVPVVIHDETLDRTTDASGDVATQPWSRIAAARTRGEPVPRLDDVAAWAAESGAVLNVEIKRGGVEAAAVAAIDGAGWLPSTLFSSFLPDALVEIRRLAPGATCYLLTERWGTDVVALAREVGAAGICLEARRATPGALAELRRLGIPVIVWTVDRLLRIGGLLRAGVRGVITNQPAVAVQARAMLEEKRELWTG